MPISRSELAQIPNPYTRLIIYIHDRQPSNIMLVVGRRGTGKTSKMLSAMEILNQYKVVENFATNTFIKHSEFPIEEITNLDDLKSWAKNGTGKKLFGFDEIGGALARRTPMSSLNIKLLKEFQRIRKYKLSTIATTISEDFVDNAMLGEQILDGVMRCPNWNNPKIALYDDFLENFSRNFGGIRNTSIEFDTWDSAPFEEHGQSLKPQFKDRDVQALWNLTHGKTIKEEGLHPQQVARLWRNFVKRVLESEYHTSHIEVREDMDSEVSVTKAQDSP